MDTHRAERVSEALREELGELIAYELSDPRIGDAFVTEVLVSPDLKHAQVRLHMEEGDKKREQTIEALDGARHFLRHQLSERLNMFRVPELHFEADVGSTPEDRLERLLARARKTRGHDEKLPSK